MPDIVPDIMIEHIELRKYSPEEALVELYRLVKIDDNALILKSYTWENAWLLQKLMKSLGVNPKENFIHEDFFKRGTIQLTFPNPEDLRVIRDLYAYENKRIDEKIAEVDEAEKIKIVSAFFKTTPEGYLESLEYVGNSPAAFFRTDIRFKTAMAALTSLNFGVEKCITGKAFPFSKRFVFLPDGEASKNIVRKIGEWEKEKGKALLVANSYGRGKSLE